MAALEIKLGQDLRLRQQLVMTPQLQQAIRILQLSLPELETTVQSEVEQNPFLELTERAPDGAATDSTSGAELGSAEPGETPEGSADADRAAETAPSPWEDTAEPVPVGPVTEAPDASAEIKKLDSLDQVDWREYLENYGNDWQNGTIGDQPEDERQPLENQLVRKSSLEDHLIWQLRLSDLSTEQQRIGAAIVYNLNDDGFLEPSVEELAGTLELQLPQVEQVLRRIQRFDPPGVGARDLRECLLLQLASLGMEDSLAARIVRDHLDLLERHRFVEIARALGATPEIVSRAAAVISRLEPKPGRDFSGQEPIYVVPDVFIQQVGGELVVMLNDNAVPRLRLASYYQRVLRDDSVGREAHEYLQERLRSAKWLVKSIYQRQQTILKVARSIVKFQKEFFVHGISHLRPLVLKNVADDIGMHESTISRATANKYAHTPQGTYELKFFFTSAVRGASGEEVSAETVKERIRALVSGETAARPLSDQAIAEILFREQINIARRTVAKYRQALGILPSSSRRRAS